MKKKIVLVGYYGSNIGDVAMLVAFIRVFRELGVECVVYSYADNAGSSYVDVEAVDVKSIKDGGRLRGLVSFLRDCLSADAVAWGGGTCFMDEGGEGGVKYFALARILGVKVMYLGVGVGKALKRKTHLMTRLASAISTVIYVRDERSKDYFQEKGGRGRVLLGPDPVYGLRTWLLNTSKSQALVKGLGRYLLVSYRCLDEFVNEETALQYLKECSSAISQAVAQGGFDHVVLMDADSSVDAKDSRFIQREISGAVNVTYLSNMNFSEQISLISAARAVLTGRLHVGVMSHMLSVPFALLNYAPKNRAFLNAVSCDIASLEYSDLSKVDLPLLFDMVEARMKEVSPSIVGDMESGFVRVLREALV
ncbi:polysaccharide pyruvyl transferase family protein [Zoogloea dura]|uniref:Polysaccharide pyruvyl transferase domain-containing protein n=1 Tax=Zoogloea dura TaxID=2728840 RepID=A0A848GHZ3_9RHOO|nr:polysaccharide pyruvyl transferase family protein [Zoogloea dura]NML29121.1 hypothetical protein [Zoogloea dura]